MIIGPTQNGLVTKNLPTGALFYHLYHRIYAFWINKLKFFFLAQINGYNFFILIIIYHL